jgi:hypothetical protein
VLENAIRRFQSPAVRKQRSFARLRGDPQRTFDIVHNSSRQWESPRSLMKWAVRRQLEEFNRLHRPPEAT